MAKEPKPFELTLSDDEKSELAVPLGQGGHQYLHDAILAQLAHGNVVTLNDTELGKLIRCMTQYGSGGFQGRLRRAFLRPLKEVLDL
ncbi:MAG TPA: hypothetical protein VLC74_12755 [Rhizomicrobium sp.]|nr:hypothetical protein [Rhizomicrobium sp.]